MVTNLPPLRVSTGVNDGDIFTIDNGTSVNPMVSPYHETFDSDYSGSWYNPSQNAYFPTPTKFKVDKIKGVHDLTYVPFIPRVKQGDMDKMDNFFSFMEEEMNSSIFMSGTISNAQIWQFITPASVRLSSWAGSGIIG